MRHASGSGLIRAPQFAFHRIQHALLRSHADNHKLQIPGPTGTASSPL
jgi:hypothetical protein